MVQTLNLPLTLEEFLKLPEMNLPASTLTVKLFKPMPLGEHSTIQGELIIAINAVVKPQKTARA